MAVALVIANYEKAAEAFCTVAEQEIVLISESHPGGWYSISKEDGSAGWVPKSVIRLGHLKAASQDFRGESDEELSVVAGEKVWTFNSSEGWIFAAKSQTEAGWISEDFLDKKSVRTKIPVSSAKDPMKEQTRRVQERLAENHKRSSNRSRPPAPPQKHAHEEAKVEAKAGAAAEEAKGLLEEDAKKVPPGPPPRPVGAPGPPPRPVGAPGPPPRPEGALVRRASSARPPSSDAEKLEAAVTFSKPEDDNCVYQRFGGARPSKPLSYTLWAHNMALISAVLAAYLGLFAILWDDPGEFRDCKVDGKSIARKYIINTVANGACDESACPEAYDEIRNLGGSYARNTYGTGERLYCCCDPDASHHILDLNAFPVVGIFYLVMVPLVFLWENPTYGFGNWQPVKAEEGSAIAKFFAACFQCGFRPQTILYIAIGFPGWFSDATMLVGLGFMVTGLCYAWAGYKQEAGDNRRNRKRKSYLESLEKDKEYTEHEVIKMATIAGRIDLYFEAHPEFMFLWNPPRWFQRAKTDGALAVYFWFALYVIINVAIIGDTISIWRTDRQSWIDDMVAGNLDTCSDADDDVTPECKENRLLIMHGVISRYGPFAKGFGVALNFNCTIIILPILRMFLRWMNKSLDCQTFAENSNIIGASLLNVPIDRIIPFPKNVAFHKLIAHTIFICAAGHTIFHFYNYWQSSEYSSDRFAKWGWDGTTFVTGAIICISMFFIYSAATTEVRHSNYYIFFWNHHWFTVFWLMLLLHGPVFWCWSFIPLLHYAMERIIQHFLRGRKPVRVLRASFTPNYSSAKRKESIGVLYIQFQPQDKASWERMKEGMYLYLNCPGVDPYQYHPFTISSARDDLFRNTTVVARRTGKEMYKVRRKGKPRFLPTDRAEDDPSLTEEDYMERHEVEYIDFVSCHIKISYKTTSWTRRFHEYIRDLAGGTNILKMNTALYEKYIDKTFAAEGIRPYDLAFSEYSQRGDVLLGRQFDVKQTQIVRVDGPHSAPSEHYVQYNTLMVVGAGVGMTPCASILTALLKYRWKKGQNPEVLHFVWITRHEEIEGFEWFVHLITELQYTLKKSRELDRHAFAQYYCEINIFVTRSPKGTAKPRPLKRAERNFQHDIDVSGVRPDFTAQELYDALCAPKEQKTPSKAWRDTLGTASTPQKRKDAPNRLGDVFVWEGRPNWDHMFGHMKEARISADTGVAYCGPPIIGNALSEACREYSSIEEDCIFTLHAENF